MSINDDSDVPFINGKYTHGEDAFYRLYSNEYSPVVNVSRLGRSIY